MVRSLLDEEKFRVERLVEQVNDLTELHQHEMANVKQDMAAMEEKMEYRLGERTSDLSDLVDNCQARVCTSCVECCSADVVFSTVKSKGAASRGYRI